VRVRKTTGPAQPGFTLVELVVVIIILACVAAIAIPRIGRAAEGSGEAALRADLRVFRQVIDMYRSEHNDDVPGLRDPGAGVGMENGVAFQRQLTWYTSRSGNASQSRDATHIFGPYLQSIPPLPVGKNAGKTDVSTINHFSTPGLGGSNIGWEYEHYFGRIRAHCAATEIGSNGIPYCDW
jgi:prepilin-type N-terminal cleavage/methylation domain-containing protein